MKMSPLLFAATPEAESSSLVPSRRDHCLTPCALNFVTTASKPPTGATLSFGPLVVPATIGLPASSTAISYP